MLFGLSLRISTHDAVQKYRELRSYRRSPTAALGLDGSIDWCCLPRFDEKGGRFRVWVTSESRYKQMYLPDTNVLMTRFLTPDGVGEVIDLMPWHTGQAGVQGIILIVRCVRGSIAFRMECLPAFDYARQSHERSVKGADAIFRNPQLTLALSGTVPLQEFEAGGVAADFVLNENEKQSFILEIVQEEIAQTNDRRAPPDLNQYTADSLFEPSALVTPLAANCSSISIES